MPDTIIRVQIEDDGPDDDTTLDRAAPAPPAAASPSAPPPWYDEYRGLRNRADLLGEAGKKLGDKDTARLDALQKKIEELSGAAPPPPPTAPPPPQPTADRTPAPPARDDLAAMREFLLTAKELKPLGFTRKTVDGMADAAVRQLAEGAGYKPPEPPAPTVMKWDAATDAATDAMDRLRKGLLSTEEALARVAKAARKGGDGLTDSLRAAGVIGKDQTAADYYRGKVEDAAEKAGKLPVADRRATVVSARGPLPVAKPITDARARMLDEQAEAREAAAERAEAMGRRARTRQMAEGVRGMAGANSASGFAGSAMQVAESGALGGRAAAMAGGPAGAAVVAALAVRDAVNTAITRPFEMAREGMREFAQAARKAAGNDGIGVLTDGADKAGGALRLLGPNGVVAGEALKTTAAAVRTFQDVLNATADRGRELARLDGRLAAAAARADVRALQADIREAKRDGERGAKLIGLQADFNQAGRDLAQPFKEAIQELLLEFGPELRDLMTEFVPVVREAVGVGKDIARGLFLKELLAELKAFVAILKLFFPAARKAEEEARRQREAKEAIGQEAIGRMIGKVKDMRPKPAVRPAPPQFPPLGPILGRGN